MNTQLKTYYTTREIGMAMKVPGASVGPILSDAGVQPMSVRITAHTHRYQWSEAAMDAAKKYRAEKDIEVAAKKKAREERKAAEAAAVQAAVNRIMERKAAEAAEPVQKELPLEPMPGRNPIIDRAVANSARRHNSLLARLDHIEDMLNTLVGMWKPADQTKE